MKQALSLKYARLAHDAGSCGNRRRFLNRSRWHHDQAKAFASRIRLGTFVAKMDSRLIPRIKLSVIPIIRETWIQYESGGSGTLFRIGDSHFLFTASHVLEAQDEGDGLFAPRFQGSQLIELTGDRIREKSLDIAALELRSDVVDALGGYTYLTPSDAYVGRPPPAPGLFYCYGFPSALSFPSHAERKIIVKAINIVADRLGGNPKFPESSREHIWLNAYANDCHLNGISGCSIWQGSRAGDLPGDWDARSARVVAVETSVHEYHTIIEGTLVRHMFRMLHQHRPALRPTLGPLLGI